MEFLLSRTEAIGSGAVGLFASLGVYESSYLFSELFVINFSEYNLIVSYTIIINPPQQNARRSPSVLDKIRTTPPEKRNKL